MFSEKSFFRGRFIASTLEPTTSVIHFETPAQVYKKIENTVSQKADPSNLATRNKRDKSGSIFSNDLPNSQRNIVYQEELICANPSGSKLHLARHGHKFVATGLRSSYQILCYRTSTVLPSKSRVHDEWYMVGLATPESKRITKADISNARTHFGCGKQKSGPSKRKADSTSDGSTCENVQLE